MQLADRPLLMLLVLLVLLPLAAELGYRLSLRQADEAETTINLSSACLGLLALLIAFTFAMAAERYGARRQLVVDEANAISTTWLRYRLLDEPYRSRLTGQMIPYVANRLAFSGASVERLTVRRNAQATDILQDRIWAELRPALRSPTGLPMTVPLLQTTNEMFDLAASRTAAREARVPRAVRLTLAAFAVLAAATVGGALGRRWRTRPLPAFGLFALIAAAMALIADLDQPTAGFVRVPQAPIERVARTILQARPPADIAAPAAPAAALAPAIAGNAQP